MDGPMPCVVCNRPSSSCCSGCRIVYYCSRQHQKEHWSQHKKCCSSFTIEVSPAAGRYLVAKKLIKAGQVILEELPLVTAPKWISAALCLGCYAPIATSYRCKQCQWPLCSSACEASGQHPAECGLMKDNPVQIPINVDSANHFYQCIGALRCLSLASTHPPEWKRLNSLESHLETRKESGMHRVVERNIVAFIRDGLKLGNFQAETIHRICAILDVNCFDIRIPGKVAVRGLYPTASLLNHDCVPNTRHIFDSGMRITLLATVDIHPGEPITATYTQSLWNTLNRRMHLKNMKHFWCRCRRCSDPRELATDAGALKCIQCSHLIFSQDPLDADAGWKCSHCPVLLEAGQVTEFHDRVRHRLKEMASKSHPHLLEEFIGSSEESGGHLHPQSCHVSEAQYALIQIYGNVPQFRYNDLSDERIQRKMELCYRLLKLAGAVEPGMSQFRGRLLYELQLVMENHARRMFQQDRITRPQFKERMKQCLVHFESSSDILHHDVQWTETLRERRSDLMDKMALLHS